MLRLFRFRTRAGTPGRRRRPLLALVPVLALGAVPVVALASPAAYAASSGGSSSPTPVVTGFCNNIPTAGNVPFGNYWLVPNFTQYLGLPQLPGLVIPPCQYVYTSGPQQGNSYTATPAQIVSQDPAGTCQIVQEPQDNTPLAEFATQQIQVNSYGTCQIQLSVPGISTVFNWYLVASSSDNGSLGSAPPPGEPAVLPPLPPGYEMANLGCGVLRSTGGLPPPAVAVLPDPSNQGYWIVFGDGQVAVCGDAAGWYGQLTSPPSSPVTAAAVAPGGTGYWMVTANGQVFAFGSAQFYGDPANLQLSAPIVGMAPDPATGGYWLVAPDGGVFSYNAPFLGNPYSYGITGLSGPHPLNEPIVGMAPTPNGQGYWMDASDGGIFAFGNAHFEGNPYTDGLTGLSGPHPLAKPIVGMAPDLATGGYWLVASDGGVFSYNAPFWGSVPQALGPGKSLNKPIVAMQAAADGSGYRMIAADGGVFDFGSCPYEGSPAAFITPLGS